MRIFGPYPTVEIFRTKISRKSPIIVRNKNFHQSTLRYLDIKRSRFSLTRSAPLTLACFPAFGLFTMKSHTHTSQATMTSTHKPVTSAKESSHSQAMPNVVPTSSSPVQHQQQQQQQRTYYWHASTPTNTPPAYYGPVVVEPYYWQQQAQPQNQEWTSPPSPRTNDAYQQIEALQTQVHEWRNNAQSWQRHCDEVNRAHEKETLKLKAKVNELLRQKTVLVEKVRCYKTAVASSSANNHNRHLKLESKKEDTTPTSPMNKREATVNEDVYKPKPVSILKSPKKSCLVSPRPLKKRRVRLDDTPQHVRCISPRTVSSAPPMPVTPPMPQGK